MISTNFISSISLDKLPVSELTCVAYVRLKK